MVETDTLFQTKTAKKLYPLTPLMPIYSLYKGVPPGEKTRSSRMSLAAYASETNNVVNDGLRRKNRINDSPRRVLANRVIKGG